MKKILKICLDFLFPKQCLICEKEIGAYLCKNCQKRIPYLDLFCPSCHQVSSDGSFCRQCQNNFYFNGLWAAGDFSHPDLAKLIKLYKYNFIQELSQPLADFLIDFLYNKVLTNPIIPTNNKKLINFKDFIIIPVPLSKKRERWRGFNQSIALAKVLERKLGIRISLSLLKTRNTKTQAKLKRQERIKNLKNSFSWTGESLKNKKIIILDDVYTTGTTINEIAKELKKQGAKEIWGLVLARG